MCSITCAIKMCIGGVVCAYIIVVIVSTLSKKEGSDVWVDMGRGFFAAWFRVYTKIGTDYRQKKLGKEKEKAISALKVLLSRVLQSRHERTD